MGADDELRLPDTRTRQSAANAVSKSASNTWENVEEPLWVVGDDEEGRDGHDSLRDCSGQTHSPYGTGPTRMTRMLLCSNCLTNENGQDL